MNITFILPGGGRSGGIRVTVEMANRLISCNHNVRIIVHSKRKNIYDDIKEYTKNIYRRIVYRNFDWLDHFIGDIILFQSLEDVKFQSGEIVVGVGVYFIPDLLKVKGDVVKLQYCHGLPGDKNDPLYSYLKYPIATISVSHAIVQTLEREANMKVLDVVPNGIDMKNYHIMPEIERDGFGFIYGEAFEKAPLETIFLSQSLHDSFPEIPQYCFSCFKRPDKLPAQIYCRFPSVSKARAIYNRSRIWFIASRNEGFCLPILEAMACGCVVISSNHENASSLIDHGNNGFIVNFNDIDAYLYYTDKVLNDMYLAKKISENAKQAVQQYRWDIIVKKMEGILIKLQEH